VSGGLQPPPPPYPHTQTLAVQSRARTRPYANSNAHTHPAQLVGHASCEVLAGVHAPLSGRAQTFSVHPPTSVRVQAWWLSSSLPSTSRARAAGPPPWTSCPSCTRTRRCSTGRWVPAFPSSLASLLSPPPFPTPHPRARAPLACMGSEVGQRRGVGLRAERPQAPRMFLLVPLLGGKPPLLGGKPNPPCPVSGCFFLSGITVCWSVCVSVCVRFRLPRGGQVGGIDSRIGSLQSGLQKLLEAERMVDTLTKEVTTQRVELKGKQADADAAMEVGARPLTVPSPARGSTLANHEPSLSAHVRRAPPSPRRPSRRRWPARRTAARTWRYCRASWWRLRRALWAARPRWRRRCVCVCVCWPVWCRSRG
jgi:hypothetical protein